MTERQPEHLEPDRLPLRASRVNPEMLVLARESRDLNQADLAKAISASQGKISKYESGVLEVSDSDLGKIARVLEYPEDFFLLTDKVYGFGSSCLYHRKRQSLPARDLRVIHATVNVVRIHATRLLAGAEIEARGAFHRMDIDEYDGSPETIARMVRASWGLPLGPVRNLVGAIENAGGIVCQCDFGTTKLDAVSHWPPLLPPLFFINVNLPADRWRFTLAHELGHIIMHKAPSPNQEQEADKFASEFLMPEREIAGDLEAMSLAKAARLKPYWRVSMQALIRRAYELGRISERHYRTLFSHLNQLGYRKVEPEPLASEEPTVMRDVIDVHHKDFGYDDTQLSRLVVSTEKHFKRLFYHQGGPRLRVVS